MLIKNMFENRESGWAKSKKQNEQGPMKVEELRREVEKKLREEAEIRYQADREEMAYLDQKQGGGRDQNRGRGQGGRQS